MATQLRSSITELTWLPSLFPSRSLEEQSRLLQGVGHPQPMQIQYRVQQCGSVGGWQLPAGFLLILSLNARGGIQVVSRLLSMRMKQAAQGPGDSFSAPLILEAVPCDSDCATVMPGTGGSSNSSNTCDCGCACTGRALFPDFIFRSPLGFRVKPLNP